MSQVSRLKFLCLASLLTLALSGCTVNFNTGGGASGAAAADGGVYRTFDKGTTWQQKVSILAVGGAKKSIAMINVDALALDPQDNQAIYAGSVENGLYYSYDGGDGWQQAPNSSGVTVTNIAVDPVDKCVIYATGTNKVYKSTDCSRTWSTVYFDTDLKVRITALVIDFSNNDNVFIGTSRGEIIKSSDRGGSWKTINRFDAQVDKIVFNPVNQKNMFVDTPGGVFRSIDSGLTWLNLEEKLKDFDGNRQVRDLIIVNADKPTIFLATSYGLLKSTDIGDTWSKINLITPVAGVVINGIAVNPFNTNEIYYTTNTTFYRSLDGGKNWTTRKLPTNRTGWKLIIDPKNPSIIYFAAYLIKK